jgi:hypothetical protein
MLIEYLWILLIIYVSQRQNPSLCFGSTQSQAPRLACLVWPLKSNEQDINLCVTPLLLAVHFICKTENLDYYTL